MSALRHFNLNRSGGEPFAEKYPRLLADLKACVGEGERLMAVALKQLQAVHE